MHTIDLGNFSLRTDLYIEKNIDKSHLTEDKYDDILVSSIKEDDYLHVTISFNDVTDSTNYDKVLGVFTKEFKRLLKCETIDDKMQVLVIGLGNERSTPDALGCETVSKIIVTRHLYLLGDVDDKYRNVSSYAPGVMGNSGIETFDIIKGIVNAIKPDLVILIDALCSSSIKRINKTIQLTNRGIMPGSGIGNNQKELSKKSLGIPIIAIGVPTVVSSVVIVHDTLNFLMKKISYLKNNDKVTDKLKPINKLNYFDNDYELTDEEKKSLLGLFGLLDEHDKKSLIQEVLMPLDANMIVTVKEIDFIIKKLSSLLADGINKGLHNI